MRAALQTDSRAGNRKSFPVFEISNPPSKNEEWFDITQVWIVFSPIPTRQLLSHSYYAVRRKNISADTWPSHICHSCSHTSAIVLYLLYDKQSILIESFVIKRLKIASANQATRKAAICTHRLYKAVCACTFQKHDHPQSYHLPSG